MKYSLPDSADDLLIKDGRLLMRSLSVYEVLRRFGHIVRLTPFRFEDFTAALLADEQSPLLAEIHIQLLKTLMREDRQQQTWLGPPDLRDAVNVHLFTADHINWPAALRIYLSADPKENSSTLEHLSSDGSKNYPFNVTLSVRLDVLEQLCDQFLLSNLAREEILNGNNSVIKHDGVCRLCSKANGDLIPCGNCTAVYHLKCSDPPLDNYPNLKNGDEAYLCSICRSNTVAGVSDCIDPDEKCGNLKRHEALGMDKLGRRFWFLVRRLFVVDDVEEDVKYYTTPKQLDEILENLNENRYERTLIENLQNHQDEIKRQMKITEDLYLSFMKDHKTGDGSYSQLLGQDGAHRNYTNHYSSNNLALSKNQHSDREVNRGLNSKFCMNSLNAFKWQGAIDGPQTSLSATIRATILKFEAMLPPTFLHPTWRTHRSKWMKSVNYAQKPQDYAIALSRLESCVKPILFKSAWYDSVGFCHLFRSTLLEREELKKTDRQPRGFERREWFSQDFEMSYRLGTMIKFSARLKPVKHQVWKQKGEEYRLTGLNAWYWQGRTFRSKMDTKPKLNQLTVEFLDALTEKRDKQSPIKGRISAQPKVPPCHNFLTKRGKVRSIFVLPDHELRKLARSGGQKESRSFSYTAKQSNYIWPYGMTPRPTFRTCWTYKNRLTLTIQDVALQLKVMYGCIRWDDLQVRPPAAGHNVIVTDEATITINLLKKRDKLPYLTQSEYLIRKVVTPIEQPTKYRKIVTKKSTPSARSGLRARRQTMEEEVKGPTTEEVWVAEDQLELWELKQFDEKIERQNQLLRERTFREEAERRRKAEEDKRRKAEQERRRKAEEDARKARLAQSPLPQNGTSLSAPLQPTTPVLRYFRTEQGQIIRLPASYLQRGTPLILRYVGPNSNQTNTYVIRPQIMSTTTTTTPITTSNSVTVATTTTTTTTTATTGSNATVAGGTNGTDTTTTTSDAKTTATAIAESAVTTATISATTVSTTSTSNATIVTTTGDATTIGDATNTNGTTKSGGNTIANENGGVFEAAPSTSEHQQSVGTNVNEMAHDQHAPAT